MRWWWCHVVKAIERLKRRLVRRLIVGDMNPLSSEVVAMVGAIVILRLHCRRVSGDLVHQEFAEARGVFRCL